MMFHNKSTYLIAIIVGLDGNSWFTQRLGNNIGKVSPKQVRLPNTLSVINRNQQYGSDDESLSSRIKTFMQYSQGQDVSPRGGRSIGRTVSSIFYVKNRNSIPSQTTSFANRQPDPAFQVSGTPIFTPDVCKASLSAIRFILLATKPALTSTPVLFVKARAVAEKLLLLALKVVCTWYSDRKRTW